MTGPQPRPAPWPEAMSYATVARYVDLPGAADEQRARRKGRRFCLVAGLPLIPIMGGRIKRVRKTDVDAYLGLRQLSPQPICTGGQFRPYSAERGA